jgi:hypothetical protein
MSASMKVAAFCDIALCSLEVPQKELLPVNSNLSKRYRNCVRVQQCSPKGGARGVLWGCGKKINHVGLALI